MLFGELQDTLGSFSFGNGRILDAWNSSENNRVIHKPLRITRHNLGSQYSCILSTEWFWIIVGVSRGTCIVYRLCRLNQVSPTVRGSRQVKGTYHIASTVGYTEINTNLSNLITDNFGCCVFTSVWFASSKMKYLTNIGAVVFWFVTPCNVVVSADVLEESAASIFRVK